jgi:hypothetical protein
MSSGATPKSEGSFFFEHEWAEMQAAARALTQQVPSLKAHIEDFVDAEDPEAGIEVGMFAIFECISMCLC